VSFRAGKHNGELLKNTGIYTPSWLIFYNHAALCLLSCTATQLAISNIVDGYKVYSMMDSPSHKAWHV
jgi:hypothetical protein